MRHKKVGGLQFYTPEHVPPITLNGSLLRFNPSANLQHYSTWLPFHRKLPQNPCGTFFSKRTDTLI